jgi:preprotein translocase subunit SecA
LGSGDCGARTVLHGREEEVVDIILGGKPSDEKEAEQVRNLGGLHVIGTERHDSRRVDNQFLR